MRVLLRRSASFSPYRAAGMVPAMRAVHDRSHYYRIDCRSRCQAIDARQGPRRLDHLYFIGIGGLPPGRLARPGHGLVRGRRTGWIYFLGSRCHDSPGNLPDGSEAPSFLLKQLSESPRQRDSPHPLFCSSGPDTSSGPDFLMAESRTDSPFVGATVFLKRRNIARSQKTGLNSHVPEV